MRNPYLSALFNPLNLTTFMLAVAAGLCAAWWLFPLGLIVWGVMVYTLASDPTLRRIQMAQSRAPLAQRFQGPFDRLERSQASIYHTLSDSNSRIKSMLDPLRNEVDSLVERTYQLCARMTTMENYRSVQSFQGNLQADMVNVETQLATATDPVVKREYEESKQAIQKRLNSLTAIGTQSDRIDAQMISMVAALGGIQAELVRLQALGPDLAGQLVPAQLRTVRDLSTQLTTFEQEVARLSL